MKISVIAAMLAVSSVPAGAEILGAEVGLSYSALTSHGSLNRTALQGAMEYGFGNAFSVQTDLGFSSYHSSNSDVTNSALHAVVHFSPETAAGAYYSADRSKGSSPVEAYGLEMATTAAGLGLEGYAAIAKSGGDSGRQIGFRGESRYGDALTFTAGLENMRIDNQLSLTTYNIGASYAVTSAMSVSAELGKSRINDLAGSVISEPYLKVGAKINFGANGVTFDNRSLSNLLPGG